MLWETFSEDKYMFSHPPLYKTENILKFSLGDSYDTLEYIHYVTLIFGTCGEAVKQPRK